MGSNYRPWPMHNLAALVGGLLLYGDQLRIKRQEAEEAAAGQITPQTLCWPGSWQSLPRQGSVACRSRFIKSFFDMAVLTYYLDDPRTKRSKKYGLERRLTPTGTTGELSKASESDGIAAASATHP